jgi:hypothetical protein
MIRRSVIFIRAARTGRARLRPNGAAAAGRDRKVLEFVQSHTFHPADFTIRSDGVCMLNPEMTRHLVRITLGCLHRRVKADCLNL